MMTTMVAELLLNERRVLASNVFAEIVIWGVTEALPESHHHFKYRLALVVDGECVLRFDNEAGKGDHKHIGKEEFAYAFISAESLLNDFWNDVKERGY